jgi:RHS repeat-associated protein
MPMKALVTNVGGRALAETRGGARRLMQHDAMGNVISLINDAGVVTDTYEYWPFGEIRTQTGTSANPWKFGGAWGYYTDATGRLYVRARYYRPSLTRWQTVDPLWPSESAYVYVGGRAGSVVDPSGKKPARHDLTYEFCGGDPIANPIKCMLVNSALPPCTKGHPNFDTCGSSIIGENPGFGGCANRSNWPKPKPQTKLPCFASMWMADFCCKECEMRVCCHGAPGSPGPQPIIYQDPWTNIGPPTGYGGTRGIVGGVMYE